MATLGYFDRTGDQQVRDSLIGNGRSVANTQLNQGNRAIQNQAFSMAASQRGGNPALAMRNAQNAAAAAGVEHNYNQAKLRAQEQLQYQGIAQAEDAKRGQVIGGILGGAGAALGTLAGPAGTALGGAAGSALGSAVNSGISGKPVDFGGIAGTAANAGLGAATNGLTGAAAKFTPGSAEAKAALSAAHPQAGRGGIAGVGAFDAAAGAPLMVQEETRQGIIPGSVPVTVQNQPTQVAAPQSQMVAQTIDPRGQTSGAPMTPPPMQQVAVNNAPVQEGQPPPGGWIPTGQLVAQTMQPQAQPVGPTPNYAQVQQPGLMGERPGVPVGPVSAPAVPPAFNPPQLATGPEPVYGNDTNPLDRRPERNGSGGTAMSREEAIRALGLSLGFGKAY